MATNKAYTIEYRMHSADHLRTISLLAYSKADAYDKAVYEAIPARDGATPYSAYVASVTYNNGNYHRFNTFEGNPY